MQAFTRCFSSENSEILLDSDSIKNNESHNKDLNVKTKLYLIKINAFPPLPNYLIVKKQAAKLFTAKIPKLFSLNILLFHNLLFRGTILENITKRYEPPYEKTVFFAYAKTKTQISFAVTAKLISVFVFATQIVQSLFFLNPKFQASSHLLSLHSPDCVGPGRKPRRLVFSQGGSYEGN